VALHTDSTESPTAHTAESPAASLVNDSAKLPATPPCAKTTESPAARPPSVLRQAEDATKRAFSRADALMAVAQAYLRGERPNRTPIDVMITIPWSTLRDGAIDAVDPIDAGLMGRSCIGAEAARRISCDAGVIEVIEGEDGVPLSVGRTRRTISGSIKRALLKRDTSCTFLAVTIVYSWRVTTSGTGPTAERQAFRMSCCSALIITIMFMSTDI
jgi:hypothetical protein